MSLFRRRSQRQIGIDIGTSSIKAVELSRGGSHLTLENYGVISGLDFFGDTAAPSVPATLKLSESEIATGIRKLLELSKIKSREAVLSIPVYSSFLTVMELPKMGAEELEKAVPYEAQSYIPVPLSDVVVDWLAVPPRLPETDNMEEKKDKTTPQTPKNDTVSAPNQSPVLNGQPRTRETVSILLIAVPKEVISKYQRIAQEAAVRLRALESESFSTMRALVGNDLAPVMLIDFGARSTTMTIVDQGFIRMNHSLDLSGKEITKVIAQGLQVSFDRAEELKKSTGIMGTGGDHGITPLIKPLLTRLTIEFKKMTDAYFQKENQRISKTIIVGGSVRLPGFVDYLASELKMDVVTGNPFSRIKVPEEIEPILTKELASSLTVACGAAMRDF